MRAMTKGMDAQIRVSGDAALLAGFRERVRQLLVRDPQAPGYEDTLEGSALAFRFKVDGGLPFPAFATASAEFPELRVEAEWTNHAQALRGRAVIENGRLLEQDSEALPPAEDAGFHLECAGGDARLALAFVCVPRGEGWAGYAADAQAHTYFLWQAGALELLAPGDARVDAELEDLALAFAAEWLWYDESPVAETAAERRRYVERGWAVRGANLRTERMARMPASRLPAGAEGLRAALKRLWQDTLQDTTRDA
jgi:hypothetical protein